MKMQNPNRGCPLPSHPGPTSRGGSTLVPAGANAGDFTPLPPAVTCLFSLVLLCYRPKMGNLCSFCKSALGPDNSSILPSAQSIAKARTSSVQTVRFPCLNLSPESPWDLPQQDLLPLPLPVCTGGIIQPFPPCPSCQHGGSSSDPPGWRSLAEGNCLKAIPIFSES